MHEALSEFGIGWPCWMSELSGRGGGPGVPFWMSGFCGRSNAPSVSISPTSQARGSMSNPGPFNNEVAYSSLGVSEYYWYYSATSGAGSWSGSGQGTSTFRPSVASVGRNQEAFATLTCRMLVNGGYYYVSAELYYAHETLD
jgi:hypothetical protein